MAQLWPGHSAKRFRLLGKLACLPRFQPFSTMRSSTAEVVNSTQLDLMYKDECILVDNNDVIIGHANKYLSHAFNPQQPEGLLHRAFSVFLFNSQNKLLLQQRAEHKITFPNVWTNTCCSHPLHGQVLSETDSTPDVLIGKVDGVKRAALRKLDHELGIPAFALQMQDLKYLTRLHYCASDKYTWGPESPWGEHEIDYILFVKADVDVQANPEEVQDTRYVTQEELDELMRPESGLLWSPWFRIIAANFLRKWWLDLNTVLGTDTYCDFKTIHKLA